MCTAAGDADIIGERFLVADQPRVTPQLKIGVHRHTEKIGVYRRMLKIGVYRRMLKIGVYRRLLKIGVYRRIAVIRR